LGWYQTQIWYWVPDFWVGAGDGGSGAPGRAQ
jgi:hypothetical protein